MEMKSLYEVINIDLAQAYKKQRKKDLTEKLGLESELYKEVCEAIDSMDMPG